MSVMDPLRRRFASGAERRAARLVCWYPASWRARYGDEFSELLVADMVERPRSWRRNLDAARCGIGSRMADAGLARSSVAPYEQTRAGLATLACATGAFLAFAVAMWSQLGIGWQWSKPDTAGTAAAVLAMTGAMVLFGALAAAAALPLVWSVVRQFLARRGAPLRWPSAMFLAGGLLLVVGGRHFENGWPGTGGHAWAHQGLVPGGVFAFAWAATLSVTSYWAHPGALSTFPFSELVWMLLSPVALAFLVVATAKTMRRLELSTRVVHHVSRLAVGACLAMVVFVGGACAWIVDGGPGPRRLFHVGAIDLVGLAVMAGATLVAYRSVRCARSSSAVVAS
jgi:hypothetical protein